jgi:hypothetical protein
MRNERLRRRSYGVEIDYTSRDRLALAPQPGRPSAASHRTRRRRVAVALLERAERCFLAWEMDKGERFLEQALSRVQESLERPAAPLTGIAHYFNLCGRAVAQAVA